MFCGDMMSLCLCKSSAYKTCKAKAKQLFFHFARFRLRIFFNLVVVAPSANINRIEFQSISKHLPMHVALSILLVIMALCFSFTSFHLCRAVSFALHGYIC